MARSSRMGGSSSVDLGSAPSSRHQTDHDLKEPSINTTFSSQADLHRPPTEERKAKPFQPTWRFWAIMFSLAVMAFCATVEGTIIINALPTITADLGGGSAFLWVPNAFFLASVATLPLYAQMSDIFGRRHLLLGAVALFILGCGLCGGSTSIGMLIAARAIQGLGSGGVEVLVETVLMDLVPLRERSKYMSVLLVGSTLGAAIGPYLGGVIVVNLGWRWIFYLNSIFGAASFGLLFVFLKVKHQRNQTLMSRLKRIDIGGNAIFIGSVVAVLLALTWGGPVYRWDSYHILVPLILGLMGFLAFTAFEWTPRLAPEPSFPRVLVSNRTSAAALLQSCLCAVCMFWMFYFLPIYFQSVLAKSPLGSGIAILPISACVVPFALISGILLSQYGRYKPLHMIGWAILAIGLGLCSLLDRNSRTAAWVCFQIVCAAGVGTLTTILLPAIQAPLEEKYVATATGMWSFVRGFGSIWGVTIPSVIFTNQVRRYKDLIGDSNIANKLASGQAYELATKAFLDSIPDVKIRDQVIDVFSRSIKTVWYVGIVFAGVGFLAVFLEKEIKLRQELNTEFGMEDDKSATTAARPTTTADEVQMDDLAPAGRRSS